MRFAVVSSFEFRAIDFLFFASITEKTFSRSTSPAPKNYNEIPHIREKIKKKRVFNRKRKTCYHEKTPYGILFKAIRNDRNLGRKKQIKEKKVFQLQQNAD